MAIQRAKCTLVRICSVPTLRITEELHQSIGLVGCLMQVQLLWEILHTPRSRHVRKPVTVPQSSCGSTSFPS